MPVFFLTFCVMSAKLPCVLKTRALSFSLVWNIKIYSGHLHEWDNNIVLMVIFIEVKYSGIEKSAWCYCGDVIKSFFFIVSFSCLLSLKVVSWKRYVIASLSMCGLRCVLRESVGYLMPAADESVVVVQSNMCRKDDDRHTRQCPLSLYFCAWISLMWYLPVHYFHCLLGKHFHAIQQTESVGGGGVI